MNRREFLKGSALGATGVCAAAGLWIGCVFAGAVQTRVDTETGGLSEISIAGDGTGMNWTQRCDGKELAWTTSEYRWGTGTLKVGGQAQKWNKPLSTKDGVTVYVPVAGLEVRVRRRTVEDGLEETYEWRNVSDKSVALSEIGIHTPFRDDYMPRSEIWTRRCFAHVWAGGSSAWVCAMRMGGRAPHLGLAVTAGAVDAYEIKLRSLKNGMSNYRGVIALSPPDVTLAPGAATSGSTIGTDTGSASGSAGAIRCRITGTERARMRSPNWRGMARIGTRTCGVRARSPVRC